MEVDILAIDADYAVLIEAKSTLSAEDINEHVERLVALKNSFRNTKTKKRLAQVPASSLKKAPTARACSSSPKAARR
jgi:beta-glucosidase-like glycosyl hydrolase